MYYISKFLFVFLLVPFLSYAQAPFAQPTSLGSATSAYQDFISRFWYPTATGGVITNISSSGATVPGLTPPNTFNAGLWWEYSMGIHSIYSYWKVFNSADAQSKITSFWQFSKTQVTSAQWQACGTNAGGVSGAQDDSAWGANGLLDIYEATGASDAIVAAQEVLDCAWNRWEDTSIGGCPLLWYSDADTEKSSYQGPYAFASLRYWQMTGNTTYLTRATQIDACASNVLARTGLDGLYWEGVDPTGTPLGQNRPYQIAMGSSVVFLAGNMAFAALDAALFNLCSVTPTYCPSVASSYLTRATATAVSIQQYETVNGSIQLNDRDATTDAWCAYEYASLVLPLLPGSNYLSAKNTLINTGLSVNQNARVADASYGGCWQGPAQGSCVWYNNGASNELMKVSAQAANLAIIGYFASQH